MSLSRPRVCGQQKQRVESKIHAKFEGMFGGNICITDPAVDGVSDASALVPGAPVFWSMRIRVLSSCYYQVPGGHGT